MPQYAISVLFNPLEGLLPSFTSSGVENSIQTSMYVKLRALHGDLISTPRLHEQHVTWSLPFTWND